ncbi:MAG: lipid-A-disaccharide synthase [Candidatus Caenarcaniphilales bacterium]|nr:lipid-A-disaccharide synthase [Candidatus Caenarcaniphilales bacterium]
MPEKNKTLNLFVCAGESSGDLHAAHVVECLHKQLPADINLEIWGMGGKKLQDQNIDLVQDSTDLGVIGIAEILKKLFFFIDLERRLIEEIKKRKPDFALLIDYPGLNLRLAAKIKKVLPTCKVLFYVAPQVWAWNKKRIYKIPKIVDKLYPILPFEEALHKSVGTNVKFLGNPSANVLNELSKTFNRSQYLESVGLDFSMPLISLFPGSRPRTTSLVLPDMLQAAKILGKKFPKIQFVLVKSSTAELGQIKRLVEEAEMGDCKFVVLDYPHNHSVLLSSTVAWLASGTVTLEAACANTPLIVGNRESWIYFLMFKHFIKINVTGFKDARIIGLPNLIAGEIICPEILQHDCNAEQWAGITENWLSNPEELAKIKKNLKEKVIDQLQPELDPAHEIAKDILLMFGE